MTGKLLLMLNGRATDLKSCLPPELVNSFKKDQNQSIQSEPRNKQNDDVKQSNVEMMEQVNKTKAGLNPKISEEIDFEDDFEPPQLEVRSKPFTIGNPNRNACTVTVSGQFLGDYYDCVACNLEEVCLLCIERCHAECPIKSHQGFGFYRCQCGGQGVPICKNLLPFLNKSISSNE